MRYFVTGATGFIGGELAHQLVMAGHHVVALVRDPARAPRLSEFGVELRQGDVTDRESMRRPMEGVDGVFHVAGWYKVGVRDKRAAEAVNVQGTRNVLALMKELSIPKGVYTSTLAVFSDTKGRVVDESYFHPGPWLSEYDRTKWVAHYEVALPMIQDGLPLVIVQPGAVYGPGDQSPQGQTIQMYLRRRLPAVPTAAAYCWGHVQDMARGHILAMEKGRAGESYIIAGPAHSLRETLELAERITGTPVPKLLIGRRTARTLAMIAYIAGNVLPLPEIFAGETLRSGSATYLGTSAKAQRELGFAARPLESGLPETLLYEMERLKLLPG